MRLINNFFRFIFSDVVTREDNHPAMRMINETLTLLVSKNIHGNIKTLQLFQYCWTRYQDFTIPSENRNKIFEAFLVTMLSNSSSLLVRLFFQENIESILKRILITQLHGNETERLESLLLKIGGLKLVAILYAKCTKDIVHSQGSQITEKAFNFLKDNREIGVGSVFNGKEMSQSLVKKLKKIRCEIVDGSPEIKEKFRVLQCEAFNTMMAVIACIQDQEKFYNAFIFKEDVGSSELIWERIIDLNQEMRFPLEMEDLGQRRSKIVSIRNSSPAFQDYTSHWIKGRSKSNHYLSDSSLSQDVTSFDFHDSHTSLQFDRDSPVDESNKSLNGKFKSTST